MRIAMSVGYRYFGIHTSNRQQTERKENKITMKNEEEVRRMCNTYSNIRNQIVTSTKSVFRFEYVLRVSTSHFNLFFI